MSAPQVEVIIAVHSASRPLARAIGSVVEGNVAGGAPGHAGIAAWGRQSQVALRVVCHDIDVEMIAASLPATLRDQVTWTEHRDGVASASGPFNAGMRASEAEFVSLMGSDDTLRPGAVASWLALVRATGADCVQTRLAIGSGALPVPTPPVRPTVGPPRLMDPVRDRLSYRSAPLGLVSTAARRRLDAELLEGMPVGGDVPYVTRLWCETQVAVDTRGPAYVIGEGARDRVTYQPRPVATELAFVRHLLAAAWFTAYPAALRASVATKLLRIHCFGTLTNRPDPLWWNREQRSSLAAVTADVLAAAPGVSAPMSRADHAVIDAILDPAAPATTLLARAAARRRHGLPATVVPARLAHLGHREAPPRFMAASWWAGRGR